MDGCWRRARVREKNARHSLCLYREPVSFAAGRGFFSPPARFPRASRLADGQRRDVGADRAGRARRCHAARWRTWPPRCAEEIKRTARAAAQFGARLESHRSQLIRAETLSNFDLVLVMERGHKEALDVEFPAFAPRVHLLSRVVDGLDYDIPDPLVSGEGVDALAASLHETLERGFKSICALASDL